MPTTPSIVHPLLSHQPYTMLEGMKNPSLLSWNMREAPSVFLRVDSSPIRTLRSHELAALAIQPSAHHLRIRCGIFSDSDTWYIEARNPSGVTVQDVLVAIYEAFQQPYGNEEFNTLCPKTQAMVLHAYHARVRAMPHPRLAWEAGIQRGDCLMQHTWFGGLSLAYEGGDVENTCMLSLRRVDDQPIYSSPTRVAPRPAPFR
ncbi:hypothetical protein FB446DRAFT_178251 [Lentinula raphanica]|uniref:DUF6699 domain-containing protein n=1 Tax=Lentinula raphanica TaxID=153919 RepID=A0AA38P7T8_9AGAR|nr:hypothetical protein FB446DRAFT_178251 [Lentinula raphanica]KAJ3837700.1 hypothetical protein F5878DRAFT_203389 [Lentinula raphanica]